MPNYNPDLYDLPMDPLGARRSKDAYLTRRTLVNPDIKPAQSGEPQDRRDWYASPSSEPPNDVAAKMTPKERKAAEAFLLGFSMSAQAGPAKPDQAGFANLYAQNLGKVPGEVSQAQFDQAAPGAVDPKTGALKEPPRGHGHVLLPVGAGPQQAVPPRPVVNVPVKPPKAKGKGGGGGAGDGGPVADAAPVDVNSVIKKDDEQAANPVLDPIKALIKKYEEEPKKLDLSPLIALTDSWTGSNLKAGYDRPMNEEERDRTIMTLRQYVAKSEADQKYKQDYLAAMAHQNATRGQIAAQNNATKIAVAEIRAKGKGGAGGGSASDAKLQKRWQDQLTQIADEVYVPKEVFGGARRQQAKAKSALVFQHAKAVGAEYERTGVAPPGLGFQTAVLHMLQTSDKGALAAAMGADDGKDDEDEED